MDNNVLSLVSDMNCVGLLSVGGGVGPYNSIKQKTYPCNNHFERHCLPHTAKRTYTCTSEKYDPSSINLICNKMFCIGFVCTLKSLE